MAHKIECSLVIPSYKSAIYFTDFCAVNGRLYQGCIYAQVTQTFVRSLGKMANANTVDIF